MWFHELACSSMILLAIQGACMQFSVTYSSFLCMSRASQKNFPVLVYRKFVQNKSQKTNKTSRRILNAREKLDFVRTTVAWISSKDIMDSCFILNFGYEAPLPWPQVSIWLWTQAQVRCPPNSTKIAWIGKVRSSSKSQVRLNCEICDWKNSSGMDETGP